MGQNNGHERRVYAVNNLRAVGRPGDRRITGYAAVFDQPSLDLGGFREVIHPGAFRNSLASGADVRALINHDPSLVIGRIKSGTLEVAEDPIGLRIAIRVPDTAAARDLLVSMDRGDVDQMSFAFDAVRDRWDRDDGGPVRHLLEARLHDVSVVTFPAYPQTSAEARAAARRVQRSPGRRRRRNPLAWARLELLKRR